MTQLIYGDMPYIKFPSDWEIKFMKGNTERMPIYFSVKKDGLPNEVAVCIFTNDTPFWEIAILCEFGDGTSRHYFENGVARVPLNNVEKLLKVIEKTFTEEFRQEYDDN